jgi:cold shock CspA family protein
MSATTKTAVVKMRGLAFAFLTDSNGGEDVFVPRATIEKSGLALQKGDAVVYEAEAAPKGPRATWIAAA